MNTVTHADYAAMVRKINALETELAALKADLALSAETITTQAGQLTTLKSNLFLAEETIKGMADDIDLWKERAEAFYDAFLNWDLLDHMDYNAVTEPEALVAYMAARQTYFEMGETAEEAAQ